MMPESRLQPESKICVLYVATVHIIIGVLWVFGETNILSGSVEADFIFCMFGVPEAL